MIPRWTPLMLALTLAGCSAGRAPGPETPADFGVSLTMLKPPQGSGAAWYVVQPDGVLRAAVGTRLPNTPLPPVVRQLTPSEMDSLWALVRDAKLLETGSPEGLARGSETPVPDSDAAATLAVTGADRRRSFIAPAPDGVVGELGAMLRDLAWLNEGR